MSGENMSPNERRKAELAGRVILRALHLMPASSIGAVLLEILDAGIHKPEDRALFGFPPHDRPEGGALPVGNGGPPTPSGDAAAFAG